MNNYVYVQGRYYYYDNASSQGVDWTEDNTRSSWPHVGWVAVCDTSGANCSGSSAPVDTAPACLLPPVPMRATFAWSLHASRRHREMLKPGDKVYIDGTNEEGTVKDVHPHEILVRVKVSGGHEDRKYAHEDLRLDPTMKEASDFYDH